MVKSLFNMNIALNSNFSKSKNNAIISFGSYHGYGWYGTSNDRDATKINLTTSPEKIHRTVNNNITYDIGLDEAGKDLTKDAEKVVNGINAVGNIVQEFAKVASSRATTILERNIEGSGIPFIGLFPTLFGKDDFMTAIRRDTRKVTEDWDEIKNHYRYPVSGAHESMQNSAKKLYAESEKALPNNIPVIRKNINDLQNSLSTYKDKVWNKIITPIDNLMNKYVSTITDAQEKRQGGKIIAKSLLGVAHIFTGGLTAFGELLATPATEIAGEAMAFFSDFSADSLVNTSSISHFTHEVTSNHFIDGLVDFSAGGHLMDIKRFGEILHDFTFENPHKVIENLGAFRHSINWSKVNQLGEESILMTGISSFANSLEQSIAQKKPITAEMTGKLFIEKVVTLPLAVLGEVAIDGATNAIISESNMGYKLKKFTDAVDSNKKLKKVLKTDPSLFIQKLNPAIINDSLDQIKGAVGKNVTGRPLSTRDFENLFNQMQKIINASVEHIEKPRIKW